MMWWHVLTSVECTIIRMTKLIFINPKLLYSDKNKRSSYSSEIFLNLVID